MKKFRILTLLLCIVILFSSCNSSLLTMEIPSGPFPPIIYGADLARFSEKLALMWLERGMSGELPFYPLLPEEAKSQNIYDCGIIGYDDANKNLFFWWQAIEPIAEESAANGTYLLKTRVDCINVETGKRFIPYFNNTTIKQGMKYTGNEKFVTKEEETVFNTTPTDVKTKFEMPKTGTITSITEPIKAEELTFTHNELPDFFAKLMDTGNLFVYFNGAFRVYKYFISSFSVIFEDNALRYNGFGAPEKSKFLADGWDVRLEDVVPVYVTEGSAFAPSPQWTAVTDILFLYVYTPPMQIDDDVNKSPNKPNMKAGQVSVPAQNTASGDASQVEREEKAAAEDDYVIEGDGFTGEDVEDRRVRLYQTARYEAYLEWYNAFCSAYSDLYNTATEKANENTDSALDDQTDENTDSALAEKLEDARGKIENMNLALIDAYDAIEEIPQYFGENYNEFSKKLLTALEEYVDTAEKCGDALQLIFKIDKPTVVMAEEDYQDEGVEIADEEDTTETEYTDDTQTMDDLSKDERPFYRLQSYRKDVSVSVSVTSVIWYLFSVSYKQNTHVNVNTRIIDRSDMLLYASDGGLIYSPEVYITPIGDRVNYGFVTITTPWNVILFDGQLEIKRSISTEYTAKDYSAWGRANAKSEDEVREAINKRLYHTYNGTIVANGNKSGSVKNIFLRAQDRSLKKLSIYFLNRGTINSIHSDIKKIQGLTWSRSEIWRRPWQSQRTSLRNSQIAGAVSRTGSVMFMNAESDSSWDYDAMLVSQRNISAYNNPDFLVSDYTTFPDSIKSWTDVSKTQSGPYNFTMVKNPAWKVENGNISMVSNPTKENMSKNSLYSENVAFFASLEEGLGVYQFVNNLNGTNVKFTTATGQENINAVGYYAIEGYRIPGSYYAVYPTSRKNADCVLIGFNENVNYSEDSDASKDEKKDSENEDEKKQRIATASELKDAYVLLCRVGTDKVAPQDWILSSE